MFMTDSEGSRYNVYADYDNGRNAIIYFHNEMTKKWKGIYTLTLPMLIEGLVRRKGQSFFLEGLGFGANQAGLTRARIKEAMETLADKSGGKIPATNQAFWGAMNDEAQVVTFIDASGFALKETAKQVISGAAVVGDKLLATGEGVLDSAVSITTNLKYILPVALFIGVGVYVYGSTKQ